VSKEEVEQAEEEDQTPGHVAHDLAVVPTGAQHGGEPLHAAAEEPRGTQEVRVLQGPHPQYRKLESCRAHIHNTGS